MLFSKDEGEFFGVGAFGCVDVGVRLEQHLVRGGLDGISISGYDP